MEKKPDHTLDIRKAIPPISLLKVSQAFRAMNEQETLEILCADTDTRTDILKVLPSFSCELILMEEFEKEDSSFRVQVKKSKSI
ncbi:MAG: sulfurtransferase TusA family protein [Deltaproteobacteria bacterium]|nr:sulfurtransferase TusA family protein [Deltaproteobacteria bacterium]